MITLLDKTGATYCLGGMDEATARGALQRVHSLARTAIGLSQLGAEAPFGSRVAQGSVRKLTIDTAALTAMDSERMGLTAGGWRSYAIDAHAKPQSYPGAIFVPAASNDRQIAKAADFRGTPSSGRLPAVCWRQPNTGVVIVRSGQPRPGMRGERDDADEMLIRQIAAAAADGGASGSVSSSYQLQQGLEIFDARPRV